MKVVEDVLPEHSRSEVNSAGRLLGTAIPASGNNNEAISAFRVAYNWRDAHVVPMLVIRNELLGFVRGSRIKAVTAARPKRMVSIRRKLSIKHASDLKLSQIQDLVGCRAIVADSGNLQVLLSKYLEGFSKHFVKHTDYTAAPRDSGYRGHHIILKMADPRYSHCFQGLKVELQIRTSLEHAWATAVEAVGLLRDENLKAGEGNQDWLRLFQLMGSEMAEIERLPKTPTATMDTRSRRKELAQIDKQLDALNTLRVANDGFKLAQEYLTKTTRPYYVLRYDREENSVSIGSFQSVSKGLELEHDFVKSDGRVTSVLVKVDKVQDLQAAYPNFFMDVSEFADVLAKATGQEGIAPRMHAGTDFGWFKTYEEKRKR